MHTLRLVIFFIQLSIETPFCYFPATVCPQANTAVYNPIMRIFLIKSTTWGQGCGRVKTPSVVDRNYRIGVVFLVLEKL